VDNLLAQHAILAGGVRYALLERRAAEATLQSLRPTLDRSAEHDPTRESRPDQRPHQRRTHPGNLVTNGQTLLTTLVSLDPIYVRSTAMSRPTCAT